VPFLIKFYQYVQIVITENIENLASAEILSALEIIRNISYDILNKYTFFVDRGSASPANAQQLLSIPFICKRDFCM